MAKGTKSPPSTSKAAGKARARKGGGGGGNEDVQRENPLQAIVFADSFAETFRPITLETPKVLLPLCNVPMLEYSLEFLASSGVQEVILFCTHHAEELEEYIRSQSQVAKRVEVHCVCSPTCLTAGDALREIDRQQVIQSNPFVLMSGDVIANVNLQKVIEEHQARKKKDASCMMTSIFKEIPTNLTSNIRPLAEELVVGIDRLSSQIVLYENDPSKRSTRLATVFLDEHAQINMRCDLMDCYIDVCSPEVLLKFAEDFDYQDLRQDFLHNEVQNYELGKKFFIHIVRDDFAARVMDPRTYGGISRAILQRWVFPMVPDTNIVGANNTSYTYHRGMIYKEEGVVVSRTCSIQRETIIGANSSFGDHTVVNKSCFGRNCRIGKNVTISGSFLWDNVVVEDNAVIKNSILCDNVVIHKGAVVEEGCILSYNVQIGEDFTVKSFTKLTTCDPVEEDDGFSSEEEDHAESTEEESQASAAASASEWSAKDVGKNGVGRVWSLDDDGIEVDSASEDEDDDEEEEEEEDMERRRLDKLKGLLIGGEDVVSKRMHKWDEWETLSSSDEEDEEEMLEELAKTAEVPFHQIIRELVITGDAAGHGIDDLFMEIKSFKFAQNRSFADVIGAIIPGLLDRIVTENKSAMAILALVRAKFDKWSPVLKRCLVEAMDQMAVVTALETYCLLESNRSVWIPLFRFLLQTVYDLEWVQEETILEWHQSKTSSTKDEVNLAENKEVVEFIEWLQEEEESDDDDDEDDSDSEEDD